jgi:hypothetical protein
LGDGVQLAIGEGPVEQLAGPCREVYGDSIDVEPFVIEAIVGHYFLQWRTPR